tara:strand:- start:8502 stop:8834 length:333 start_codon:yes stop_codon:yes gene_type:complete
LQSKISEIREAGAEVLAISSERSEVIGEKMAKLNLDYPVLADPDFQAIDAFGLRHVGADPFSNGDIARPAVFLIGKEGEILWSELTENWRVRVTPEMVLEQVQTAVGSQP